MELMQMPSCCGMGIIHGLPETAGTSSKTAFEERMSRAQRAYGCVIVSINDDQKRHWAAFFKKMRLELKDEFYNRNSGNTVYLYSRVF
jgi:hypothetical protein